MLPQRGPIQDRNGEPLAVNVEVPSLAANPKKWKPKTSYLRALSRRLGVPYATLKERLDSDRSFVWLKRHLSDAQVAFLKEPPEGLWLVKESRRVYPNGTLASQVLGQANIDLEGIEGMELKFDSRLRGESRVVESIRDGLMRPAFLESAMPESGAASSQTRALQLTLDSGLQFEVEKLLHAAQDATGAESGSVLVMDASTGEILVMAGVPSFDPNRKQASPALRRNRIVTDGFEPGSTMKPFLVLSALQAGKSLQSRVWGGMGKIRVQGHWISEAKEDERFGWLTLEKLLQVSSNVGSAALALDLGAPRLMNFLEQMGFGSKSGIEFPGEISGWLPQRKQLPLHTLASMGFGQGMLATRLQVARAYAAILNGGWLVRPTLLKDPEFQKAFPPVRVFPAEHAVLLQKALAKVTQEGGTGLSAQVEGYRIAGKTGTAQMIDPRTRTYSQKDYIASFAGFALDLEPKLVVLTVLDKPKGSYYSASTAAPLFKSVFQAIASRLNPQMRTHVAKVHKDHFNSSVAMRSLKRFLQEEDSLTDLGRRAFDPIESQSSDDRVWVMPSLKGLSPRELARSLKGHSFDLEVRGFGTVARQFPEVGRHVSDGDKIVVHLVQEP